LTVDGVLTADGFLPTELNPRYGAAMDLLARPLTELSLLLLNLAIVEDEPLDWQANELERLVVASSDAQRAGGGLALVHKPVEADQSMELAIDQKGDVQQARKGETADAIATLGPSATGGFLRVELAVERTPIGPSVAGRVGKMLRFADIHWDLGIGELEPAREVRT
jgi:hypothetical protein